jgi:hypothetical protein
VDKTPQGGLRIAAHLTRVGVFKYDDGNGGTIAEYRPREEVEHADSLATLTDAPFTVGHPGMVTPDNHASHATGHVRDPRMDGERVAATVVVQGRKAIRAIEKGTRQLSCGYTCKLDETPGTTPTGERYDRVQRNIRYNHVALVDRGRAGDDVRLRLDAAGNQSTGDESMEIERIDGVPYTVGTEAHTAACARRDEAERKRKADADALQAKYDKAAADLAAAQAENARLADPARLDEAAAARAKLVDVARRVLGDKIKLDGMSDAAVRLAVVAKVNPTMRLDGKSEAYVQPLYDAAVADLDKAAARADEEKRADGDAKRALAAAGAGSGAGDDIMLQSRLDRDERNRNAWRAAPAKESA